MSFDNLFKKLSDLPVAKIADDVTLSVLSGVATTLSSATGSGKTLFQSAHLASHLDEQLVILVPRRFLAVNAAETVAELCGFEIGKEVGYAIGSQAGDKSCWSKDTKLVFATNGFALASGLILSATALGLDEVHETSMDLSIIRALVRRRMSQGESIKLLEMSATMNAERQAAYWHGVAETKIFEIDGKTYECDVRYRPAGRVEDEVMNLINEGRRGVLVFRPGVGEVNETVEAIESLAATASMQIEVAKIFGEMGYADRSLAVAAPKDGGVKVLVGTNVVESGVNIPWVDSGATCGTGKENNVRPGTGATFLELIDLPRWRLAQQEGRVKRFCPGVFVLCSPKSFSERAQASRPEIERLALTELVMHCAGFGLRAHELRFDYAPSFEKILEAELKLQRLGLIDTDCMLTDAGKWITGLPVGPETGAMLWHARETSCLTAMLPLAAVIEVGGIRKDFHFGHFIDSTSDYLDGLCAFKKVDAASSKGRREVLEKCNVGYKRYEAASDLLGDLQRRLDIDPDKLGMASNEELRRCILAGSLDKLFVGVGGYRGGLASVKSRYTSYNIGQGSAVDGIAPQQLAAGDLRVITPKDRMKSPFTVLEKVTRFHMDDLKAVATFRPEILAEEKTQGPSFLGRGVDFVTLKLFGKYVISQTSTRCDDPNDDLVSDFGSDRYSSYYGRFNSRW
jgi:HrpA-like RNA helicase